jgi:hypothetical protein
MLLWIKLRGDYLTFIASLSWSAQELVKLAWRDRKLLKSRKMKDYIVTAQIKLEVQARNEAEAKQITMEDLSDFMRHNSLADLMEVREKE